MDGGVQPVVTVGLPVYNGGQQLRRALESLLAQDYPALEIVIRDNASTDETASIAREIEARDPRVRYLCNESNLGAARNFERVLQDGAGPYFMWAAHDDCWSPDYVGRLVAALRRNPRAVLAAGRAELVDLAGNPVRDFRGKNDSRAPDGDAPVTLLREHATHWIYGVFVRERLVALAPRLWAQRIWGGDMVWLMALSASHQLEGVQEAVVYKTQKPSSFSPAGSSAIVNWQIWYGRSILREVLSSPLPLRRKVRSAAASAAYWWRYVTASGMSNFFLTWAVALRNRAFRRQGREP
jgi:glycosyltransferase involved in cell wall biosynthesis